MAEYKIIKLTTMWSTSNLVAEVEQLINEKAGEGYTIVTVSFGLNVLWLPTAFVTICKNG